MIANKSVSIHSSIRKTLSDKNIIVLCGIIKTISFILYVRAAAYKIPTDFIPCSSKRKVDGKHYIMNV